MTYRFEWPRCGMALLALLSAVACKPSSLVGVSDAPNTVVDPSQIKTASSATALYNSALGSMTYTLNSAISGGGIIASGLLTDELQATADNSTNTTVDDARSGSTANGDGFGANLYRMMHEARVQQQQARQALALYAPNTPKAWQGQLYANEAYTVLMFAEWYCSGIPLTAVPLVGPQVPTRGFTTEELYTKAIALFDSAMVVGADSAQFVNLARVGKARALLALGQFATADTVVQSVPTNFVYTILTSPSGSFSGYLTTRVGGYRAQNHEGGSPMVWSADPRTGTMIITAAADSMVWAAKYFVTSSGTLDPTLTQVGAPARLADGLEARLIQAEAALHAGNPSWLTILDTLRATCIGTAPCAPVPGLNTTNLPTTLTDPGTSDTRLDLVMKERAMWLYMTAHREGDLRRLAHVYHRDATTLWPTGTYLNPAFPPLYNNPPSSNVSLTTYGNNMVLLPDPSEQARNPLYGGCYDRNP